MINSAENYPVSTLLSIDEKLVYRIPRYQREYTWGKLQWDTLLDDLLENNEKYFLGSIICIVENRDVLATKYLELVDGQQRLTTLSLLMAAIYYCYKQLNIELNFDEQLEIHNLKHKLILRSNPNEARLIPQVQNSNQQDYFWVLNEAGVIQSINEPRNAGNRRVVKAFRHFCNRIEQYIHEKSYQKISATESLRNFLDKVNTATMIKIEVDSHSNAYTLFESLNNRGVPLTAIDLIKNKLLSKLENVNPDAIDNYFQNWREVVFNLGDEYAIQERFFRQYYNAFKPKLAEIVNASIATKSNLINIYEKLISHDAEKFINKMLRHSEIYSFITCRKVVPEQPRFSNLLKDLERIQGVPSYLLLMLLLARRENLNLEFKQLEDITSILISFFVRRNTTDKPATRDLTRIFMDISSEIMNKGIVSDKVVDLVKEKVLNVSSDDDSFRKGLSGALYEENKGLCRFILCSIEQSKMTKETEKDLWLIRNGHFIWTIEHIFPQGENIPQCWIDMISSGNENLAKQYLQTHVHKLGNLTISGYNSTLGNNCFIEKRDKKDKNSNFIGYKNGLFLNENLSKIDEWTISNVDKRTNYIIDLIVNMYPLPQR